MNYAQTLADLHGGRVLARLGRFGLRVGLALLCVRGQAQVVDERAMVLSFPEGHFLLEMPVAGASSVTVATSELLDVDDVVRSRGTGRCSASGICRVEMPGVVARSGKGAMSDTNRLPMFRVRYGVGAAQGIVQVEQIASALYEVQMAALDVLRRGNSYSVWVKTVHPLDGTGRSGIQLQARLMADAFGKDGQKKQGRLVARTETITDSEGFATVRITVPKELDAESVTLSVSGMLGNVSAGTEETLQVGGRASMAMTTDKPLYQPGQTVHTRMLVLDREDRARAGVKMTVDVRDPDSKLVYRGEAVTSPFGIATLDWVVGSRLRLGPYSLHAVAAGGAEAGAQVQLSRYDLPTFAVTPTPDRPFYLTGQNATVEVRAKYLFGEPVKRGHVRVVRQESRAWNFREQRWDVKEGKVVEGELGADGSFMAAVDLAEDEKKLEEDEFSKYRDLKLVAYVTDASSGRTEERRFDMRVTREPLHVYLLGKSRQAKGLPQKMYVAVMSADGKPVECDVDLGVLPKEKLGLNETAEQRAARGVAPLGRVHTDSVGVARLELPAYDALERMVPGRIGDEDSTTAYFVARDGTGRRGTLAEDIDKPDAALRVETDKALYRVGEPVVVTVESSEIQHGPLMVQVVRWTGKGSVVLGSREVQLLDGKARLIFASDARFSGNLFVNAVALGLRG